MSEVHESQLFVEDKRNITDKHQQTSPLTEITTSPPQVPSDFSLEIETSKIDTDKQSSQITETLPREKKTATSSVPKKDKISRNNSIDSYISSDLSEIDSEAETDKMEFLDYQKSDLEKLAKQKSTPATENAISSKGSELSKIETPTPTTDDSPKENGDDTLTLENKDELAPLPTDTKKELLSSVVKNKNEVNSSLNGSKDLTKSFMNGNLKSRIEDEDEMDTSDISSSNESKRRSSKESKTSRKRRKFEESEIESTIEENEAEQNENDNQTEEANGASIEESEINQQRKEAIQALTEIEIDFAELRDNLFQDKLQQLEYELKLCLEGAHPELQKIYLKIDNHFVKKKTLAENNLNYKLQCIDNQTKSQRLQLHQQFFKNVQDSKFDYLTNTTEKWYKINKERTTLDNIIPDYNYKLPTDKNSLILQRNSIHKEISSLSGLKKYYGFPSAPEIKSAKKEEIEDDLTEMGLIKPL